VTLSKKYIYIDNPKKKMVCNQRRQSQLLIMWV